MAQAQTSLTQANKLIKNPGTSKAGLQMSVKLLEDSKQGLSNVQVEQVDSVIRNVNRMISRRVGVSTAEAAAPPSPRVPVPPAKSTKLLEPAKSTSLPEEPGFTLIREKGPKGRTFRVTDEELALMQSGEILTPEALIALRKERSLATERPGFINTLFGELGEGAVQVGKGALALGKAQLETGNLTGTAGAFFPDRPKTDVKQAAEIVGLPVGVLRMIGAPSVAAVVKGGELVERQSVESGMPPETAKIVADALAMGAMIFMPQKVIIGPYRFVANQIRRGLLAAKGGARAVLQRIIRATQQRSGTNPLGAGEDFINAVAADEKRIRAQVGVFIEGGLNTVPSNVTRPLVPLKASVDDALVGLEQVEGTLPSGAENKIRKLKNFVRGRQRAADKAASEAAEAQLAEMSTDDLMDAIDDIMLTPGVDAQTGARQVVNGVIGAIRESITEIGAAGIGFRPLRELTSRFSTVMSTVRTRVSRSDWRKLVKVRSGLEDVLESFGKATIDDVGAITSEAYPEGVALVQKGVKMFREEIVPIYERGGVIEGITRNKTGSELVDKLMKIKPERLTGFIEVKRGKVVKTPGITESIDPVTRARLSDGFLAKLLDDSEDLQVGGFQIPKFLDQLNVDMMARFRAVMSREDFSNFLSLRGELQRAQETLRNIPETAQLMMRNSIAETIKGVGTLNITKVVGAIGTMIGRETGAKLLASTIALPLLDKATTDPRLLVRVTNALKLFNIATVAIIRSEQAPLPEFQRGRGGNISRELLPVSEERFGQLLEQGGRTLQKAAKSFRSEPAQTQ